MLGQDLSKKMNNRGGLPVKNIVTAIFILLSIYLLYIYNVAQNNLHDAEMTGSRYRREAEEKASEIQGLISAKDDFQERCETEKRELNNRLKSINQKHSMLQSQNTEIEADFMKLKQDMENLRAEHMQTESQHAQEYQSLKQTKEKEIADLTDQVTASKKQNEDYQVTINQLQIQIQNYETAKQSLLEQNEQLHQLHSQQQRQLELQKQNEENAQKAKLLQQQQQQINFQPEANKDNINNNVNNNNVLNTNMGHQNVNVMSQNDKGDLQINPAPVGQIDNQGQGDANQGQDPAKIDQLNAVNQAKPPNMEQDLNMEDDDPLKGQHQDSVTRPEVNPNDLQQGQILEPLKEDGGEADEEGRMNQVREVEARREREEAGHQAAEHRGPLDLGQMQEPLGLKGQGQQLAPVIVEKQEDENKNEDDLEQGQQELNHVAVNPVAPL